jgi:hypothetical protein
MGVRLGSLFDVSIKQIIQVIDHLAVDGEVDAFGEIIKHSDSLKIRVFRVYRLESF